MIVANVNTKRILPSFTFSNFGLSCILYDAEFSGGFKENLVLTDFDKNIGNSFINTNLLGTEAETDFPLDQGDNFAHQ